MPHTPGPWRYVEGSSPHFDVQGIIGKDRHGERWNGIAFGIYHESDAHLISAAPDLLEACRYFIEYLPEPGETNWIWHFQLIEHKIRAAIAKAEGKE